MKQVSMQLSKAALFTPKIAHRYQQQLLPEIERLKATHITRYTNQYASVWLPFDTQLVRLVDAVVLDKKQYCPAALIVIGIGGSSLGTKAIHEAIHGLYYNNKKDIKTALYFVETIDSDVLSDILEQVETLLQQGKHVIVNVISKSGTTTETIANYEFFIQLLKKYYGVTWHHYVVVTTEEGSRLWELAVQHQTSILAIPVPVGGRYSVFSAVGLFPLAFLGIDISALLSGARNAFEMCTQESLIHNPAALGALFLTEQYHANIRIHDMFLFSVELEGVGKWYRQLMGESLGKMSQSGREVGITPTVSIGTTDLHSVGQLYLGGPRTIGTTFVTVGHTQSTCIIPEYPEFEPLVAHIQGKPIPYLMDAVVRGILTAYDEKKIPYMVFQLPEKKPYYIGQLLQCKMIEIMYVGYLLEVNPFDQPHVEQYKTETRKILAHE